MNQKEINIIKKKALEDKVPIIMDDTLEAIAKVLSEIKPNKILEIGTAVGYSAICFSEYLQENGKIDTIERDTERVKEARKNIKKAEVEEKINIYEQNDDIVFELSTSINAYLGKRTLYLEKGTGKPKKMVVQDDNNKDIIYILYNEIDIKN